MRCVARVLLLISPLFLMPISVAKAYEANCQSATDCGQKGDAAFKRRDYQAAITFYQMQMQDAELDRTVCEQASPDSSKKACSSTITAYNNLALANLRAGEPAKAKMWLSVAPDGPSTQFNKRLVANALASKHWPSSPEGEYWQYAGFGLWSEVTVTKNGDLYSIIFDGYWMPARGWHAGANSGHLSDNASILNGIAILHDQDEPECTVTLRFKVDRVELSETDECDGTFGMNVSATGTFTRVSSPQNSG